MEPFSSNGFGSNTYWNRPTFSRSRSNRPSRSLSPAYRQSNDHSASSSNAISRPISPSTATVNPSPVFNTEFNTARGDVKGDVKEMQRRKTTGTNFMLTMKTIENAIDENDKNQRRQELIPRNENQFHFNFTPIPKRNSSKSYRRTTTENNFTLISKWNSSKSYRQTTTGINSTQI